MGLLNITSGALELCCQRFRGSIHRCDDIISSYSVQVHNVHDYELRTQASEGTGWKNVRKESSLITFQVCLVSFAATCQGDACGSLVLLGLDLIDVEEASDKAQENVCGSKSRNLTISTHLYCLV